MIVIPLWVSLIGLWQSNKTKKTEKGDLKISLFTFSEFCEIKQQGVREVC